MARRKLLLAVFALIGVLAPSLPFVAGHAAGVEPLDYSALLARVKQHDLTVDFSALRRAYAQTADYRPDDPAMTALRRSMDRDFDDGHRADARQIAKQILVHGYIDIDAHRILEEGDTSCADYHRTVADGLTQSILDSGNGKSPATAFLVLSIDEEYAAWPASRGAIFARARRASL
jgi:hypothetical protein